MFNFNTAVFGFRTHACESGSHICSVSEHWRRYLNTADADACVLSIWSVQYHYFRTPVLCFRTQTLCFWTLSTLFWTLWMLTHVSQASNLFTVYWGATYITCFVVYFIWLNGHVSQDLMGTRPISFVNFRLLCMLQNHENTLPVEYRHIWHLLNMNVMNKWIRNIPDEEMFS